MAMVIDGKRVCLYMSPTFYEEHKDGKLHYYPGIVTENEPGYNKTDWDWGTDLEIAQQCADEYNERNGCSKQEQTEIVMSSFRASRMAGLL